jgi:hypothetical protein
MTELKQFTIERLDATTAVIEIPRGSDRVNLMRGIVQGGGFWFTEPDGVSMVWTPLSQIRKITAT